MKQMTFADAEYAGKRSRPARYLSLYLPPHRPDVCPTRLDAQRISQSHHYQALPQDFRIRAVNALGGVLSFNGQSSCGKRILQVAHEAAVW